MRYRLDNWIAEDLVERFWQKVDVKGFNECWEWQGSKHIFGYGTLSIKNGKYRNSHRFSWILFNGPIEELIGTRVEYKTTQDIVIRHICNNPPCVNPNHLIDGTKHENTQDMLRAGRQKSISKLSKTDVYNIRLDFSKNKHLPLTFWAKKYNIDWSTISNIVRGIARIDCEGPIHKGFIRKCCEMGKNALFTLQQAIDIRKMSKEENLTHVQIAERFNCHPVQIGCIVNRYTYKCAEKHLEELSQEFH